ncbi:MAG TPA: tetratricopeptide repeat protein [Terriglobales bacterium]|nr:tetratricopeptide repeat protein [Terriglobales bacterium]
MVTGRIPSAANAAIDYAAFAARPRPSQKGSDRRMNRRVSNAILLIVITSWLTAGVLAQDHTTVRHYKERVDDTPPEIAQAEEAIQKNDFSGAETLLKKAIAKDPRNYQAWFDLGFVLNQLGRTDDSIHAYRQSVAAKPEVFETNLNLGLMLARLNSPEAERFLRAATTLKPTAHPEEGQARAWLALAHLMENTKPEDAFQAYGKAVALTPKDPEPHLSAGLLHERQKEFSDAEAEYKQAITLDPHLTEAVIGLTNIYMKSGRLGDAEPLLRRLAAERPADAGVHLQLGRVLAAQGKNDDAIGEMQTGLKLAPTDIVAQRDLADLYAITGKNDLAETAYRSLVTAHPNDAELHRGLGKALLLQKKFPEAEQEFLVAVRLKRDWADVYVDLAFAASENKNYDLTIRALNGRALLNGEMPALCFFIRATAYDHLRDNKQAALDYHHFLEVANGKYPDQEWQATHRLIAIEPKKR